MMSALLVSFGFLHSEEVETLQPTSVGRSASTHFSITFNFQDWMFERLMSEYFIALILAAGHWLEVHWFMMWSSTVTRRLSVSEAAAPAGWRLWLVGCSLLHSDLSLRHDSKCHWWTQEDSTMATHWISCFFPQFLHCTHSRSTCSRSWSSLAPPFRISKWSNSCMFLIVLLKQLWWLGKQRGKVKFLFSVSSWNQPAF